MKQICKTRKIRKTLVDLLSFCMEQCGTCSWRFSERFKQVSKYNFAISLAVGKHMISDSQSDYKFVGLKCSEKHQEQVPHCPMQKFNKFTKVFRIFLILQTCFIS